MTPLTVIPAKAGTQGFQKAFNALARLRGNDAA